MTDPKAFIREWLDVTTLGPEARWHECITDDVVMRFPYVPPQFAAEQKGREAATAIFREVWKSFEQFEWFDVVTRKCEGEDYMSQPPSRRRSGRATSPMATNMCC